MSINKKLLKVSFKGNGTQIFAYLINDTVLEKLKDNASSGHQESSIAIVQEKAIDSWLVCWGINSQSKIEVQLDGIAVPVKEFGLHDDPDDPDDFDNSFTCAREEAIVYLNDDISDLEPEVDFESSQLLVIEVIEYDEGHLRAQLEISPLDFKVEKIGLNVVYLDGSSDLSFIYQKGYSNDIEVDIRTLKYEDNLSEFELDFSGFSGGGTYLLRKGSDGDWEVEEDSEGLFED